jgi:hypothetical protein
MIETLSKPILSLADVAFLLDIPREGKPKEWRRTVRRAIARLETSSGIKIAIELPHLGGRGGNATFGVVGARLREAMPELFEGIDHAAAVRFAKLEAENLSLRRRVVQLEAAVANAGKLFADHDRIIQRLVRKTTT